MSVLPRPLAEWFKGLRERYFLAAVRVTVEEAATDLEAESIDVKKRRVTQLFEALDFVGQLSTDGDEDKERALAAYHDDVLDIRNVIDQVLTGRMPFAEGREVLRGLPPESASSGMTSPVESRPAAPKALADGTGPKGPKAPSPASPPDSPTKKRGRGRPRKYPRPEADGDGRMADPSPGGREDPES